MHTDTTSTGGRKTKLEIFVNKGDSAATIEAGFRAVHNVPESAHVHVQTFGPFAVVAHVTVTIR